MSEYKFGVFIGRFQPLHDAHLAVIQQALAESESLILLIGSAKATIDIKNPFTFKERVQMISAALDVNHIEDLDFGHAITLPSKQRVWFIPIRDYFYSENMWIAEVQHSVARITKGEESVALYGSYKDGSSYYVNLFPQWDFRPAKVGGNSPTIATWTHMLNATDIRNALFEQPGIQVALDSPTPWYKGVPDKVVAWIRENLLRPKSRDEVHTERYNDLQTEYNFIKKYRDDWSTTPYPVTFVTTDAVVVKSGHVLVIKRKFAPGKGLWALPGGFLKQDKSIEDSMLTELKEETRIRVDKNELRRSIIGSRVFDYPGRDYRGRTITHAYHIDLGSGELPEVKGGDDAKKAIWIPLVDALSNENRFYSDHWHIIYHFIQDRRMR